MSSDRDLFDELAAGDHDAMTFSIVRDVDPRVAGIESAEGISFSSEALTGLFDTFETFIGARIYARMMRHEGPVRMQATISLKFDDFDDPPREIERIGVVRGG